MDMMSMIYNLSEGNPGALMIIMNMMESLEGQRDLLTCSDLNIKGSKLYMLNSDCCKKDPAKFKSTINMLRNGVFSIEEIHENLDLPYAIPFLDDNIIIDGVPPYGADFGPGYPQWEEYCAQTRESFDKRMDEACEKWNVERRRRSSK